MRTSTALASSSSGSGLPSACSARSSSLARLSSPSVWKTSTRARDNSAALSSKDGFSVVAPTRMTVPSSMTGRKESCCARLKRWISSTNSSVWRPLVRRKPRHLEHLLEVGNTGKDRRNLLEGQPRIAGKQPCNRRLAGAGRPPEDHRAERAGADHPRQRTVLAGQVLLADHLRQRRRPQPVGQRPRGLATAFPGDRPRNRSAIRSAGPAGSAGRRARP